MPKRGDGNEDDLRVRPRRSAHPLTKDNPFTGEHPLDTPPCAPFGTQTDLPPGIPPTPPGPPGPPGPPTPEPTFPAYDWTDLSGICPYGLDIRSTNRIILQILKGHFSDPNKIVIPSLKQYVYTTDPVTSKIRIVLNTAFNLAQNGLLPAIVVKRGLQKQQRLVIGDLSDKDLAMTEGITGYSRAWQGAHRIMVLGTADGQVEDLALEVNQLFTCLSPILRSDVPFLDFQVTDMSELGIIEDLGQTLGVAIEVIYTYEYGWRVVRNAPELRGVAFETAVTLDVQD